MTQAVEHEQPNRRNGRRAEQPRHMQLSIERKGVVATIRVGGEVDAAEASALVVAVNRALCDGAKSLVVDCAKIEFIDSMGLNALVEGRRRATTKGSSFTIASPSPHVFRMLGLAGLRDVLSLDTDVAPAR
jgi:anti-sigma B factor antagonist